MDIKIEETGFHPYPLGIKNIDTLPTLVITQIFLNYVSA